MEPETKQWIALIQILSNKKIRSTLYSRQREEVKKRALIWREAAKSGLSTTQIANAFNVTRQAVSKALNATNKGPSR
jgi:DNA invertase Pin-like site-specific DNA recombinase